MSDRVWRAEREGERAYAGIAAFAYQLALGVSARWYEGQPHIRLYLGPVKVYAGLFLRRGQAAFTGGDR